MRLILSLTLTLIAFCAPAMAATPRACQAMMASSASVLDPRPVEPLDLLRLRDIGYMHPGPGQRLIALSPDKRQAAFVMHRADPSTDRYCVALVVLDLSASSKAQARIVDMSDDLLMARVAMRGMEVDYGLPRPLLPQWSADGQRIAYLRKVAGVAQIFETSLATGKSRQVSRSSAGVDDFARDSSGAAFVFRDRPERLAARAAITAEREKGYLVDDRILPYAGTTPALRDTLPYSFHHIGRDGASLAEPSDKDRQLLDAARTAEGEGALATQLFRSRWALTKSQAVPGSYTSPTYLVATRPDGRRISCGYPACQGTLFADIEGAWETDRQGEFAYLRREGWGGSQYGLYLWQAGKIPHRLLVTDDLITGCESLGARLLCARETSLRPRHLITIDLRHMAHIEDIYDPNPDYVVRMPPQVKRLHWRNARGQESFADLVLPADRKAGQKLPLIIVQYVTRGFLRGGTGDEYSIAAFARNGFAVLSMQKPSPLFAAQGTDGLITSILPRLNEDWADRRNIHSSLIVGIERVLATGDVDVDRIGISGVSDGSTTVQFGLINSPGLFKAASIGSCCVDPTAMMIYGGSGLTKEREAWGYPPYYGPGSEAWQPLALARNRPDRMAPLLMQLADNEFIVAMETLAAYEKAGRPVEARIFPQEHHLKASPRHRLAVYCRNLRWFGFWLDQPIAQTSCPAEPAEMQRWIDMKARAAKPE